MEERTTSSTGGQKGVKLERFDLIPTGPLAQLAEHFGRGARKYAENQWRNGYEWSKSFAALQRHLNDFWSGKDFDVCSNDPDGCAILTADGHVIPIDYSVSSDVLAPDGSLDYIRIGDYAYPPGVGRINSETCYNHTGSHHLTCAAWHSFVLLEFTEEHPEHDDRYRRPE